MATKRMGSYWPCPDSWKLRVIQYLKKNHISRKTVAAAAGCNPSMVTKILRLSTDEPPGPATSRYAKAIADFTQIPLPVAEWETYDELLSMLDELRERDVALHDHAIALVKQIAKISPASDKSEEPVVSITKQKSPKSG